jgi:hypothetical protein
MVDQTEARKLAEDFLSQQDLRGYSYIFSGVTYDDRWPDEWGIVFDVYSPEMSLIDGPVVLVVSKTTGEVRTM